MLFKLNKLIPISTVPLDLMDLLNSVLSSIFCSNKFIRKDFNEKIKKYTGFEYIRTFQSGSLAFYNLINKLRINEKNGRNEVIIPVYTCPSLYYAIKDAGLKPIFVDIDNSFYSSIQEINSKLSPKTLAVVIVHMFGNYSFNIKDLKELLSSKKNNSYIIEDFCQSFGMIKDKIKNSNAGDYYILSFGRAKMISTINGGAVLSKKDDLEIFSSKNISISFFKKFKLLIDCIINYFSKYPFVYYYIHKYLSNKRKKDKFNLNSYSNIKINNHEMCGFQFKLGSLMFEKLNRFNAIRNDNAKFYDEIFKNHTSFRVTRVKSFFWRYPIIIKDELMKSSFKDNLKNLGIYASTCNYPLLDQIEKNKASTKSKNYSNASYIASNILTLPTHPSIKQIHLYEVFNKIKLQ